MAKVTVEERGAEFAERRTERGAGFALSDGEIDFENPRREREREGGK